MPFAQGVHDDAPDGEKVPAKHEEQDVAASKEDQDPGMHAEHAVMEVAAKILDHVPTLQETHAATVEAATVVDQVPALQRVQLSLDIIFHSPKGHRKHVPFCKL